MRKKKIVAGILAGILTLSLAGCGEKQPSQTGGTGEVQASTDNSVTAYIGTNIFTKSMDPIKGGMSYGYPFISNALLRVSPDSAYVGDLATDWAVSEDALTYTYTLREDVVFSDGSPFTAEDVVFTYEKVLENPAINEQIDLSCLESVSSDGDYKVIFQLKKPFSPFFDLTAQLGIVPSDGYDSTLFDTMPIGTGAFKMSQYDVNQQMILKANESCWYGRPKLDQVTLVCMDPDAAFAAARSGQLDVVMVGTSYSNEEIPGMTLTPFETMDVRNISLALQPEHMVTAPDGRELLVGNQVMNDIAVRKALSIGIHRQAIIDKAFNGIGKPASHFTDNLVWASANGVPDGKTEEAIEILEKAGWIDTDGDGVREKDGLRCTYDIYAGGGDMDRFQLAAALAEEAKPLGIELVAKNASWDEVLNLEHSNGVVLGGGQYSPMMLSNLYSTDMLMTGIFNNVVGYSNPEVDALIQQAIAAGSPEEAISYWKQVQDVAAQDYAYLFLVNIQHCYFVKDGLDMSMETQVPHPHGHGSPVICNMNDWNWK